MRPGGAGSRCFACCRWFRLGALLSVLRSSFGGALTFVGFGHNRIVVIRDFDHAVLGLFDIAELSISYRPDSRKQTHNYNDYGGDEHPPASRKLITSQVVMRQGS
jgi:hypothetical protein